MAKKLNPYADCVRTCKDCPVAGLGEPTVRAVGLLADLFGNVEGSLEWTELSGYQRFYMASVALETMEAPSGHNEAVQAAIGKVTINNLDRCLNSVQFSGA